VVTATEPAGLYRDQLVTSKTKKLKKKNNKSRQCNWEGWGYKPAYAGVRGLNMCRIQSLFGNRTKQTFSDQNSPSFITSI